MMNNNQIGVTFMPSAENQADGPRQGGLQGDVGQALKILSLQLPRVMGARAISPPGLLRGGGADAMGGGLSAPGFNPHAAVFQALLHAMAHQGGSFAQPNITPGVDQGGGVPGAGFPSGTTGNPEPQQDPMGQMPNVSGIPGRMGRGTMYRQGGGY